MLSPRSLLDAALAKAARSYVAGADLAEAVATAAVLHGRGVPAFTFGYWNPRGEKPEDVMEHHAQSVTALALAPWPARVAVKAPAFAFRPDLFHALLERASPNIELHLDAHGIDAQDATLALGAPHTGVTLPSRWMRSALDAARAAERGLAVRVVKGQFAAPAHEETDPRAGFLRIVNALAHRARRVSIASHDAPLVRDALAHLVESGTPCELELLYGLPPQPALDVARGLGVPVRLYVPWGTAYLPYAAAKAFRHPRSIAWLARDVLLGRRAWPRELRATSAP